MKYKDRGSWMEGGWETQAYLRHEIQEQTMSRNIIKINDKAKPIKNIFGYAPGEMFRYRNSQSNDAIYMKTDGAGGGSGAVMLATGMFYTISQDADLEKVYSITIG